MAASGTPERKTQSTSVEQAMGLLDVGDFDEIEEDIVDGDDIDGEDDNLGGDEVIASSESNGGDEFSLVLAELETMMMDEAFNSKVDKFTEQHCDQFDDSEENKLIYTSLFSEYTKLLEAHIEQHLGAALESFDMQAFCSSLAGRSDAKVRNLRHSLGTMQMRSALSGSLVWQDPPYYDSLAQELPLALELLSAYGDFDAFKAMMLSCKVGRSLGDMGVVGGKLVVHVDEQEDGIEMPDLMLSISSASNTHV